MDLLLPNNPEAEGILVARIVLEPSRLSEVVNKVSPEDFYVEDYRDAFRAMVELSDKAKSIDAVSISVQAGRRIEIPLELITPAHQGDIAEYANAIRQASFYRKVISFGQKAERLGMQQDEQVLAKIHDDLQSLARGFDEGTLISPSAAVDDYFEMLNARSLGLIPGLKYGIKNLDQLLQPASAGDMVIIAARPSIGKTALAENIADNWSRDTNYPILFVSREMTKEQLLDRAAARDSGVPAQHIIRNELSDGEMDLVRAAIERRRTGNIWYLANSFVTSMDVRTAAAKVKAVAGGISGIVVDYLQLLADSGDQEVQRVTKISRNLKGIAMEFGVPSLVLSQLNRQAEYRADPHPKLHDIRESGAPEQDADVVLGLHRGSKDSPWMDVEVLKNRQGPVGRVTVNMDVNTVRIY
jgi:replicative DNA helicase